ncbi:helix-turn-helix transcriptional regulator [Acinetobacter sp. ESL0695]|uniref:response regulator transcription factor n=1 Tax=Acinetobacter sp. ESL0695 TaxID=2983215 RepID=UPI0023F2B3F5|nr:helix-turn-helix transcriptional regulator [Acinetobacter sp. ESL0695]WEV48998.1 helix-turn-helix transcriptional regulator [Acinetobacter sp. ESL0695]
MITNSWDSFLDHFLTSIHKAVPFSQFFAYEVHSKEHALHSYTSQNISKKTIDHYIHRMSDHDPIYFKNNIQNTEEVLSLGTQHISPIYQSFLNENGVLDNIELIFKQNSQTVRGISLVRNTQESYFSEHELMAIQSCHSLAKHSLTFIPYKSQKMVDVTELTSKEKKVLDLILQGKKNQDIANILFISITTVKTHIQHIFQKMLVSSKSELIVKSLAS